jgi:phosphoglycerol geranylgeranyltransferase
MKGVLKYLTDRVEEGPVHMTLIDPDKAPGPIAKELAGASQRAGSGAIMVGGSTGLTREGLDDCILGVRESFEGPIILFPPGATALSPLADALYFMSLMNSRDPRFIVGEQMRGARAVRAMDLEPIPLGYVIVEPGMAAGKVGCADPVGRDDIETAVNYALCAQYMGMKLVYFEAGSGAPEPIKPQMVSGVRREADIIIVAGGGIRKPDQARELVVAGADVIVTGTLVEDENEVEGVLRSIIEEMAEGWRKRT